MAAELAWMELGQGGSLFSEFGTSQDYEAQTHPHKYAELGYSQVCEAGQP